MVRLKAVLGFATLTGFDRFNSAVVRLKEFETYAAVLTNTLFQFRCGTIKGYRKNGHEPRDAAFQFRCGTIKG